MASRIRFYELSTNNKPYVYTPSYSCHSYHIRRYPKPSPYSRTVSLASEFCSDRSIGAYPPS